MIYREFRKEVCAWCFRYECGRAWKIRFTTSDDSNTTGSGGSTGSVSGSARGGVVFCSEECKGAWKKEYGDLGLDAYAAVDAFVQKQARNKGQWVANEDGDDGDTYLCTPTKGDVDEVCLSLLKPMHFFSLRIETIFKRDAFSVLPFIDCADLKDLILLFSGKLLQVD